ncbi:AAA family ATPase [bacterium]|nr:AAA family ATPase [bacterium]MBU1994851.1 AAA family ATPase [bacterium]
MLDCLHISQLYRPCDISLLSFTTTDELELLEQPVGQESALEAVEFAANIRQDGYNLFAMGPSGSGKFSTVESFLQIKAKNEVSPQDWCYIYNFKDQRKPIALELPTGKASQFKNDIYELIELLKVILPSVFDGNDYHNERELIYQKYINKQSDIFNYLREEAKKREIAMNATSSSRVTFAPLMDGKILSATEYNAITGKKKDELERNMSEFELIVKENLRNVSILNKSEQKELKTLAHKTTQEAVEVPIDELRKKYTDVNKIIDYLDALQNDVIRNVHDFLAKPEEIGNVPPFMQEFYTPSFNRYNVNLFISHEENTKAPVIFEDNPIHQNLIGTIEHTTQIGTLVTDFTMIKPGALHKANGGYLILDARKLLMQPFAYEELKRVLRAKEIRIESLAQQYSFVSTTTLEPEPIPLNIKIVLIGERILYYLLYHYDPDFKELFKVNADFEDEIPRNNDNIHLFARMIGSLAKRHKLFPLTPEALGRVIEQSSREVSHSLKFSTHLRTLSDLLKEADYWSKKEERTLIEKSDINKVLETRIQRMNRIQMKLYEQIDEGTIMINISGSAVGQINALTYISMGGHNFGLASRITARTRIGKGEIIDIERKVELGGPLHSKGVMILSSYLGSTYASDMPLSLSASLVFEQSYGMIEGDSASSTELYALLSSLSNIPIKQNFAVTGSVNQFGEIQAIGGVNEKIEGFFDICMRKNPESFYGVIIPHANIQHLMLKKEIIQAVTEGKFAIYGVKTINEGISVLTGVEAGEADSQGKFPSSCVNAKVIARLKELSETLLQYSRPSRTKAKKKKKRT